MDSGPVAQVAPFRLIGIPCDKFLFMVDFISIGVKMQ
jgi:hypothetical protein